MESESKPTFARITFHQSVEKPIEFEVMRFQDLYAKSIEHDITAPHRVDFYQILYIEKGSNKHLVDFQAFDLQEGDFLFVGKNQVHAHFRNLKIKGFLVLFTESFLLQSDILSLPEYTLFNEYNKDPLLRIPAENRRPLHNQLLEIADEYESQGADAMSEEIIRGLLRVFLLRAERLKRGQLPGGKLKASYGTFVRFKEELRANLHRTRNALDYAEMLACSPRKLNAMVQEATGQTTKTFIDEMVVLEMKRLLANSGLTISEIAYRVGFGEPTNMIKYFKRRTGQTPRHFRESQIRGHE